MDHKEHNHQSGSHSHHAFDDAEHHSKRFDAVERDEWQKPDKVIASLNLSDDATVLEIGAGTGYFTVRLAEHVKKGKVIVFDQSANMISHLKRRVKESGLSNVQAQTTEPNGGIALEKKADLIFSADVYHHIKNRIQYFYSLASYLTSEGTLVIIDRTEKEIEGQPLGHRISAEKVKEEMKEAGFELVEELNFLLPIQYYLTFKPIS